MMKVTYFLIGFFMLFLISFASFAQNQTKQYFNTKLRENTKVGYLAYTPPDYYSNSNDYPVIIFLHGIGERGSNLDLVASNGPPRAIKRGVWPKSYPFIVISPQSPFSFPSSWDPDLVNEVINVVKNKYRIDANRIYVTGFSMGGNGAWAFGAKYPDVPAAIVPMAGWGDKNTACNMKNLPIWAFHGQTDYKISVNKTKEMVNAVNACGGNAKGTYPGGVGHTQELWEKAYKPDHYYYNPNIYDWMLTKSRSGESTSSPSPNEAPHAKAGEDKILELPKNSITLWGSGWDNDGKIASFNWSKISGPSVTLENASTSNLSLSNMVAGEYQFKLTVKDDRNATASDWVKVTVNQAAATAPPPADESNGLSYSYYEGSWSNIPNFNNLSAKKTGKVSNFTLSPKLRDNYLGFMFQGSIEIKNTGTYTFYTNSDDGSKLYINGKEVVNNDGLHGLRERSGKVYLSTGKHTIKVVYIEAKGGETLQVKYAGPGVGKQNIPNGVLYPGAESSKSSDGDANSGLSYSYYEGYWSNAPDFNNLSAKKTGNVSNFSLAPKLRDNHFGFKFQGSIEIKTAGTYTFYTASDDGSLLYINNKVVVNNDGLHSHRERYGKVYLPAGKHSIRVVYFEQKGGETLEVKYAGPGVGKQAIPNNVLSTGSSTTTNTSSGQNGLAYSYFEGTWSQVPNFDNLWAKKTGNIDNFTLDPKLRWNNFGFMFQGDIEIKTSGTYTFYTGSDDGSKLFINNNVVVNNDGLHGYKEKSGQVYLTAGKHPIKVVYFEQEGGETLNVKYSGPGIGKQVIPDEVLFLRGSGATTTSTTRMVTSAFNEPVNKTIVYPNSFENEVNVDFTDTKAKTVQMSIIDQTGRVYYNEIREILSVNGEVKIDLHDRGMSAGIYFLKLNYDEGESEVVRLLKK